MRVRQMESISGRLSTNYEANNSDTMSNVLIGYLDKMTPVGVRKVIASHGTLGTHIWLGKPVSRDRIDTDLPLLDTVPSTDSVEEWDDSRWSPPQWLDSRVRTLITGAEYVASTRKKQDTGGYQTKPEYQVIRHVYQSNNEYYSYLTKHSFVSGDA